MVPGITDLQVGHSYGHTTEAALGPGYHRNPEAYFILEINSLFLGIPTNRL